MLAESIPWNRFLGSNKSLKMPSLVFLSFIPSCASCPFYVPQHFTCYFFVLFHILFYDGHFISVFPFYILSLLFLVCTGFFFFLRPLFHYSQFISISFLHLALCYTLQFLALLSCSSSFLSISPQKFYHSFPFFFRLCF